MLVRQFDGTNKIPKQNQTLGHKLVADMFWLQSIVSYDTPPETT